MSLNWQQFLLSIFLILMAVNANYNPFMDNDYFAIDWPGSFDSAPAENTRLRKDNLPHGESLELKTIDNEKYRCFLPPDGDEANKKDHDHYTGPDELELLKTLFEQTTCSYRIESYWTYELCHGKYLRQYHEEKEMGKKPTLQEYYLGYYQKEQKAPDPAEETQIPTPPTESAEPEKKQVHLKKVEGIEIPYHEVNMTGGTPCDLTNKPRRVALHYVCQPEGKGEIYEMKEVSTCEYEVIVLTNLLCRHPAYQMKKDPVSKIQCHSLDGSPRRPRSLDSLELENTYMRYNRRQGEPISTLPKKEGTRSYKQRVVVREREETQISPSTDQQLLTEFFSGEHCLHGGTGWWKHEFCYGKHVVQYHEDQNGRTSILLGKWNEEEHVKWLSEFPSKRPKLQQITLFYSKGDFCELSGAPRNVEVKLKCKENPTHPHSIAIYLVEPTSCQYHLVVESAILCNVMGKADSNGIIKL